MSEVSMKSGLRDRNNQKEIVGPVKVFDVSQ